MKKVAVILSGCGVYDGSEIYEAVFTLLALDKAGAQVQCLAPDIMQHQVINHVTGEKIEGQERNVLVEAGRICRGQIQDLAKANPDDYDALMVPGGLGAATNLCDFAINGANCTVNPQVLEFAQAIHKADKPIGLVCIAPVMSAAICGEGVECTVGNDADTGEALKAMGAVPVECPVDNAHVDRDRKLVTTPAFMLASNISEAAAGINVCVEQVLDMA